MSKLRSILLTLSALLFLASTPHALHAQLSTTATITGLVTDTSGSVVPGADVSATNEATRVVTHTQSNSQGQYVLPGLSVARYSVSVAKDGFNTYDVHAIDLHPAVTTTVNAALKVGSSTQTVNVTSSEAAVETATPETSASVPSMQVTTLPLNGRNYQGLATLMPGVQNTSAGTALTTGGRATSNVLSVNGLQTNKTFYALDGIWNENTGNMTQTTVVPNPDSLEEVRVLQNNFSARYSLMGSSVVLLQTKSGTSSFHGAAWEFLRNDDLNAKNYFATSILPYKQNIFGYNLGGPIFIPHLYNTDKQKTFFFFSEQFVRLTQTPTGTLTGLTPTQDQRDGLFSSPIKDPSTGANFVQNASGQYVLSGIDANAAAYLAALYPLPNYSNGSGNNYINTKPQKTAQRDDEIKIDHNFSPRLHLLGEYLDEYQEYQQNNLSSVESGEIYSTNSETDYTHNKLAQLSLTQVLSPSMVNTTSIAMNIFDLDLDLEGTTYNSQVSGFNQTLPYDGNLSDRLPLVTISGGIAPQGIPANLPQQHAADLDNTVSDDWSWLKGNHYLQAGATIVFNTKRQDPPSASNGQFTFTGTFTKPTSGAVTEDDAIADFLLGDASTFTQTSNEIRVAVHGFTFSPYLEDRVKLTRNLTATVGLRAYFMPLPYGPPGTETNFVPSAYSPAEAPIVNASGTITTTSNYNALNGLLYNNGEKGQLPKNFSNEHNWYLGPEIGFAWDVFGDGKTSFRGGYGLTYTRVFTNQDCSYHCALNPPALSTSNLQNPDFSDPAGTGTTKAATISSLSAADQDIQATQVHTYSASLEHEFPRSWTAGVTGAASQARHVVGTWNLNAPAHDGVYDFNPVINAGTVTPYLYAPYQGYAAIGDYRTHLDQNWNALEVSVKHPVSDSLFATVSYTYSHDLTNYTSVGTYNVIDPYNPQRYYGNAEGLNYPHSLALTGIYSVPWLKSDRSWRRAVFGGWQYSDITTIRSGTSISPGLSVSDQGNAVRPNRAAGVSTNGDKTVKEWFNTAAFSAPAAGYLGNAGIGTIRGPGLVDFDMSLYKTFHVAHGNDFEFRAEAFNVFNHTNFSGVSSTYGSSTFGEVTSASDPRILEFALKYKF
ncbi:TonB-dependent receptor [Silvibacterium dinghuense]|uniref:Cna protein B-type domain-containing protein n=1 Tax=Silvibacterium dinghuense TaxID=1560006 RepID=A0A4Q1S813_9BACT|nr:carboxypeptidase regulatory-like domain-containing protein [Silvibacterium dinghuense]RXS92999.1 Cna protein B-type domain-containing protein [Silvibacterium dinghuense]GGG90300.1 hypothetical protein GCM10011586_00880 [Silvibacterium dinghuense]